MTKKYNNWKHGKCYEPIYLAWARMKQRCNNPNKDNYRWYGGAGIGYDPKWEAFENFYNDMKETYDQNLTLDRIDSSRDYSKENCRWTNWSTQANNKSSNHILEHNGKKGTIAQWAKWTGLGHSTISMRLQRGWSDARALTVLKWSRVKS